MNAPLEPILALDVAGVTHCGGRDTNEDAVKTWASPQCVLSVVADGVGGEPWGEVASSLAAAEVAAFARDIVARWQAIGKPVPAKQLVHLAFRKAARALQREAQARDRHVGMRATLLVALAIGDELTYGYLGDGGIYLCRPAHDSLVELLDPMRDGEAGPLTGSVGPDLRGTPVVGTCALVPGSIVLSTTDGLADLLTRQHWLALCRQLATDTEPAATLDQLLHHCASLFVDGQPLFGDNLTVSAIRVGP